LRIVGELKKLVVTVSKGSVANVVRRHRLPPAPRRAGPSWTRWRPHWDRVDRTTLADKNRPVGQAACALTFGL
jgi:hypothetical protein